MAEDLNGSPADTANAGDGTPAANPAEDIQGTSAANTGSEIKPTDAVGPSQEAYDALNKELSKARQNANRLENKAKEEERQRLEDNSEWETLARKTQTELDTLKQQASADKERKEAEKFRDTRIALRPEKVQDAARKLIDRNPASFFWGDVSDWSEAQTEVDAQLDALQEALGETNTQTKPEIDPNNPNPSSSAPPAVKPSWKELEEKLADKKF